MTDRDPRTEPVAAPPQPSRPGFEFRQRPSESIAARATAVSVSYGLWLGAAAAGLVAAVLAGLGLDDLRSALLAVVDRDFANETAVTRDRVVAVAAAVLIGIGLLVALAQAGFARGLRAGRGGARFALVVLGAVSVVDVLLALGVMPLLSTALLLLSIALAAVGAVLMYTPDANRWFASRRD